MYDVVEQKYILTYKNYGINTVPEYLNQDKLILTYTNGKKPAYLYPKYYNSQIGSTANTMYNIIQNNKNKDNLITFLESELIHYILLITQYSRQGMHKNEFKILNLISKPTPKNKFKNDDDIYKYYNISEPNIKYIKKIIAGEKTKIKTRKHHPLLSKKHTRKQRSLPLPPRKPTRKRTRHSLPNRKHTRKHTMKHSHRTKNKKFDI